MIARIYVSKKSVQCFCKRGGKVCVSFSSCSTPGKGLYSSSRHLKPISVAKDLHQVLKPEKKLALGMPPTSLSAASNITHSAIAEQDSSQVTTTFNADCTVHCAVGDFNIIFCESRREVGTIPYRTACMISRAGAQHPRSWNCDWGRSAVHLKVV